MCIQHILMVTTNFFLVHNALITDAHSHIHSLHSHQTTLHTLHHTLHCRKLLVYHCAAKLRYLNMICLDMPCYYFTAHQT